MPTRVGLVEPGLETSSRLISQTLTASRQGPRAPHAHPIRRCLDELGDRHDGLVLGQQAQSVSAAPDAGIEISPGQLMQHFPLHRQLHRRGSSLHEKLPLYPGPELLSIRA